MDEIELLERFGISATLERSVDGPARGERLNCPEDVLASAMRDFFLAGRSSSSSSLTSIPLSRKTGRSFFCTLSLAFCSLKLDQSSSTLPEFQSVKIAIDKQRTRIQYQIKRII